MLELAGGDLTINSNAGVDFRPGGVCRRALVPRERYAAANFLTD
jgi:hypothetical protein